MTWRCLFALIGLSITGVSTLAQERPGAEGLSATRRPAPESGFFGNTPAGPGVVRFQLIQGRLCLDPPRHRKGKQSLREGEVYESITVTAERGIPSLHYVLQSPHQQLTLSVQNAVAVRIESWLPETHERSILDQPSEGTISWRVSRGDLQDRREAMTVIHLRHQDSISFDAHFGLLFERMMRGRSLEILCQQTQQALFKEMEGSTPVDPALIQRSVEQLGSARRRDRILAQRQLLAWGTPVLFALQQHMHGDLDAEQLNRLQHVIRQLRIAQQDTPASLSKLLVNDSAFWKATASQLSEDQRRFAAAHLARRGIEIPWTESIQRMANLR